MASSSSSSQHSAKHLYSGISDQILHCLAACNLLHMAANVSAYHLEQPTGFPICGRSATARRTQHLHT